MSGIKEVFVLWDVRLKKFHCIDFPSRACALVPNKRVVLIVGDREFSENLINQRNGGSKKSKGGKLGNPYLKIRHKIMFLMRISKLTHSFSTSI